MRSTPCWRWRGEGAMDAANILKPALPRGELQRYCATTLDEYQKYFEKDSAERRFQKIIIEEPDTESDFNSAVSKKNTKHTTKYK
jgi:ATP-dependent Clp protease ATP-binding subunit ClpA